MGVRMMVFALVALGMAAADGCVAATERVLTEPVGSQTIELRAGDRVTVQLEENCTTGYEWVAEGGTNAVVVAVEHLPPTWSRTDRGRICGAPGRANITVSAGEGFAGGEVRLAYRRPWSGETAREIVLTLRRK